MPHLDFEAARRQRKRTKDPLTFRVGCLTTCPQECPEHLFTCLVAPTIGDAIDLADAPEWGQKGAVEAVARYIESLLATDDDVERWNNLLRRREDAVEDMDLFDIAVQLVEAYTGANFGQPTGSSPGQPSGGDSSRTKRSGPVGLTPSKGYSASGGASGTAGSS